MNDSIIRRIISHIEENNKKRQIIIVDGSISKKFVSSSLKSRGVDNFKLYRNDEYVFEIHNERIINFKNKDMLFLGEILYESNKKLKKHNFSNEIDNIYDCINNILLQRKICIRNNDKINIGKLFQNNVLSYESKIFFEILKLWISYTQEQNSYVNRYMQLIDEDLLLFSDADHHFININKFFEIEKLWIQKNIPSSFMYTNKVEKIKNKDQLFKINNKVYESYDFKSHEDELEFISSDISKNLEENPLINIALINNDRYFARRLRALLARKNIEISDEGGWLLSTSACCAYINNIIDYFFENNNFINLRDIIMSPFFQLGSINEEKKDFLKMVLDFQKGDIESEIKNFFNNKDFFKNENSFHKYFIIENNLKDIYTFKEFSKLISSKIDDFGSSELINEDTAGKEFLRVLENLGTVSKKGKKSMLEWSKILKNKLEISTFSNPNISKIIYTDINHALINDYDKIYISSMSNKNYPKKILNNFSEKNIIYSDFSINSNLEERENISDFFRLSKQTNSICLTFHKTDNNEIYSKSKFKILVDHIADNKVLNDKEDNLKISKNNIKQDSIYFDSNFKYLNYRDIENYLCCIYCFYYNKKFNYIDKGLSPNKYLVFGNYVHSVISRYVKDRPLSNVKSEIISKLNDISNINEKEYYLQGNSPYELKLWKDLLPTIATEFFYSENSISKSDFKTEVPFKKVFLDNITLSGRYDIQYFNKGKKTICDFKTSTNIPSKKSVLNGEHLQLPMYSLLNPNVEIFEYYFINVSQKITKRITFEKDEFINSTDIILDTIERINFDLKNKTKYYLMSSYNGCENCGFQVTREK